MELKNYQQESLVRLKNYLETARLHGQDGNIRAYERVQTERFAGLRFPPFQPIPGLENVPYVCLRLPTGGGKTLLCAHTVSLAGHALWDNSPPLVLWMVPTTTIKNQTLETLKKPSHANYLALESAFGSQFRVFDIADFVNMRPQDLLNNACIVVSTFASLRVENTEGRRVYDHHEELEAHFTRINPNLPGLERNNNGTIKYSFVNLLNVNSPLVLIDEAHNAKSELSVEVLRRVNPKAVIEYTATPAKNSNVIQSVTAAQLKAEHMIKLPIMFAQHADWQAAVTNSIQTRARLEQHAQKDLDYIRPLVLFQAENKAGAVTTEVLHDFLVTQENIPDEQIALATGDQRELDGINLFDPNCQIRYVITVQALKEGWNCSFAYVLCSVANIRSTTAVEQLLGRVLRMPYATPRSQKELNQAYAHVSAENWPYVVTQLTDRLISMGFEKQEADSYLYQQPELDFPEEDAEIPPLRIRLTQKPDLSSLDFAERTRLHLEETFDGSYVLQVQNIDEVLCDKIGAILTDSKDKREWNLRSGVVLRQFVQTRSPAERGEKFVVPQLCLWQDNELVLLEKEELLGEDGFDALEHYRPLSVSEFSFDKTTQMFAADIEHDKIRISSVANDRQLPLEGIDIQIDATGLAANLARNLYRDVDSATMSNGTFLGYLNKTVQDVLARPDITLAKLVRGRFLLEKVIRDKLNRAQQRFYKTAFEKVFANLDNRLTTDLREHGFSFPEEYPAARLYDGRFGFKKHYYPLIAQMNHEEAECAQVLDAHPKVRYWVRNLERQLRHAFSLPTATDWFYPDFVAQLNDGRIMVIEYKGEHLKTNEDTQEKDMVGQSWAKLSGNFFLITVKTDKQGRDIAKQIDEILC